MRILELKTSEFGVVVGFVCFGTYPGSLQI